jgi:hypothetical protein
LEDIKAAPQVRHAKPTGVVEGGRNEQLFRACLRHAAQRDSFEELSKFSAQLNATFQPPLLESELVRCVENVWRYHSTGRNLFAGGMTPFERLQLHGSRAAPDALYLYELVQRANWNRDRFVLSKALAEEMGWGEKRFRKARLTLEEAKIIACIHPGGQGPHDPPRYRWGRRKPDQ